MFLYVIAAAEAGPCKLGVSVDPARRLRQLQTGHPEKLALYHSEPVNPAWGRKLERLMHKDINYLRSHGEWFALTVAQAIAQVRVPLIEYDAALEAAAAYPWLRNFSR